MGEGVCDEEYEAGSEGTGEEGMEVELTLVETKETTEVMGEGMEVIRKVVEGMGSGVVEGEEQGQDEKKESGGAVELDWRGGFGGCGGGKALEAVRHWEEKGSCVF